MFRNVIFILMVLLFSTGFSHAQPSGEIYVQEMLFCKDIQDRRPIGIKDTFSNSIERVYCYTKIIGVVEPAVFTHVWYWKDVQLSQIELPVRAVTWRTWSYKTIVPEWTGQWRVDVVAPNGEVICSRSFTIIPNSQ